MNNDVYNRVIANINQPFQPCATGLLIGAPILSATGKYQERGLNSVGKVTMIHTQTGHLGIFVVMGVVYLVLIHLLLHPLS